MGFFVDDLLDQTKMQSFVPVSESTFNDSGIISILNDSLKLSIVSDLISVREDFFITSETVDIEENVRNYAIPSRAVGNSIKQVLFVDTDDSEYPLERVEYQRITETISLSGKPEKYYIEGDEIFLITKPTQAVGKIKFRFPARPNELTLKSSCAKITSMSDANPYLQFSVDTDLTTSLSVGQYIDIISTQSPFKLWVYRAAITQITSNQIDIERSLGVNINDVIMPQVGDYICPSGYSCIPQIPLEFHPVLQQVATVQLLESLGDLNKLKAAKESLAEIRRDALNLVKNRVEASPQRVSFRKNLIRSF